MANWHVAKLLGRSVAVSLMVLFGIVALYGARPFGTHLYVTAGAGATGRPAAVVTLTSHVVRTPISALLLLNSAEYVCMLPTFT